LLFDYIFSYLTYKFLSNNSLFRYTLLMKKAFTMIELVFVLVVIGILAAVIIPNTKTNPVMEAAIQLVSDIRYTQHLAMTDDKYSAATIDWYRKRWQIVFINSSKANNQYAYTIFSDTSNTGDPNISEIAKNPQNPSQLMTGGSSGGEVSLGINDPNFNGMKKLNLGMSYGVSSMKFSSSCSVNGSKRIAFDYIGRPIKGKLGAANGAGGNNRAYESNNLIQSNCDITLSNGTKNVTIRITRETGYTSIL